MNLLTFFLFFCYFSTGYLVSLKTHHWVTHWLLGVTENTSLGYSLFIQQEYTEGHSPIQQPFAGETCNWYTLHPIHSSQSQCGYDQSQQRM